MRTLLAATTALGIWMWIIVTLPVETSWTGQIHRFAMFWVLCGFTAGFHKIFQARGLTGAGAALWAGIPMLLMLVFLAFDRNDWSILQPWNS